MTDFVDTHAHLLELKKKSPASFEVFARNFQSSTSLVLDVGIQLEDSTERHTLNLELQVPYWSLGLYPSVAQNPDWKTEVSRLEGLVEFWRHPVPGGPALVALGEMGIDHYRDYGPDQGALFEAQLSLACNTGLPVIVHCREAAQDCYDLLKKFAGRVRGIMHCFSLDAEWALKFADLGMYLSFAGNCTYPGNKHLVEALKVCPQELILAESDCPYLAPVPHRKEANRPDLVPCTLDFMAGQRQCTTLQLHEHIKRNLMTLLG